MYKIILTSQKNTVPEEERLLCSESLSWSLMKYIWSDCYTCRDLQLDGAVGQLLHWHPTKRNKTPLFAIVLHALFHSVPLPPNHLLVSLPSICSFRLPSLSLSLYHRLYSAQPCPLRSGHSLGFSSGGHELHQGSWSRPVRPCSPVKEHPGGE